MSKDHGRSLNPRVNELVEYYDHLPCAQQDAVLLRLRAKRMRRTTENFTRLKFWRSPTGIVIIVLIATILFPILSTSSFTGQLWTIAVGALYLAYIAWIMKTAPKMMEKRADRLWACEKLQVDLPVKETFKMAESAIASFKKTRLKEVNQERGLVVAERKGAFGCLEKITLAVADAGDGKSTLTVSSESVDGGADWAPKNPESVKHLLSELEKNAQVHLLLMS